MASFFAEKGGSPENSSSQFEELYGEIIKCCESENPDPNQLSELGIHLNTYLIPEVSVPLAKVRTTLALLFAELDKEIACQENTERIPEIVRKIKFLTELANLVIKSRESHIQKAIDQVMQLQAELSTIENRFILEVRKNVLRKG